MARRPKPKPRRPSGALRQAQNEAAVRFGPEKQALGELLFQARQDLASGLAAEHGAAEGIKAAVHAAAPELVKHYGAATGRLDQAHQQLMQDTATLSASADPLKAVAAGEAAAARARLNEAFVGAQTQLQERTQQAAAARQYGVQSQIGSYNQKVAQYGRQAQGLAARENDVIGTSLTNIQKANRDAAFKNRQLGVTVRGQDKTQQTAREGQQVTRQGQQLQHRDRQTANQIRAKGKKGPSRGAIGAHQKILAGIQDASLNVDTLRSHGVSFPEIGVLLKSAKKAPDKDGKGGNPYGGVGSLSARAAVELIRDGHLSPQTLDSLAHRGLLPSRVPKGWRPPPSRPKAPRRSPSRPGSVVSPW